MGCRAIQGSTPRKPSKWPAGCFQAEADPGLRMLLAQFQEPFPDGFRGGVQAEGPALAGGRVEEAEVAVAVGAVQTDDQVIGRQSVHHQAGVEGFGWKLPAGLTRRRQ
jgi:hypothetical protein